MKLGITLRWRLGALDLDVALEVGSRPTALIGPNGAGKTTLLRAIAGSSRPDHARLTCGDRVLLDTDHGIELPPEQRAVGYVPQGYALFPHLRAIDNITYGLSRLEPSERRARAQHLLSELEAAHLSERRPAELSGGEQQRVALARALAIEPDVLLLDEPLAAIDVAARRSLRRVLAKHLQHRRLPALIVTHDVRDVHALDADVCVLDRGKLVQQGSMHAVFARPANDFVAEFCGADLKAAPDSSLVSSVRSAT